MDQIKRRWLSNSKNLSNVAENEEEFVTVISYNILAELHMKSWTYPFCPQGSRGTLERHPQLMVELEHNSDADVICLQEVETSYFEQVLLPAMRNIGYEGVHAEKMLGYAEGAAVFYKKDTLELEQSTKIVFSEEIWKLLQSKSIDEELRRNLKERCNHESVGLICRMKKKGVADFHLNVANVHLLWRVAEYGDVNTLQAAVIANKLKQSSSECVPFVLCGDFNHNPSMPGYKLLKDKRLDEESIQSLKKHFPIKGAHLESTLLDVLPEWFQHPCNSMTSSYLTVLEHEPDFTVYTSDEGKTWLQYQQGTNKGDEKISKETSSNLNSSSKLPPPDKVETLDYIWYSSDSFECTGVLDLVDAAQIAPFWACPNRVFPSDHFLMKARFRILQDK